MKEKVLKPIIFFVIFISSINLSGQDYEHITGLGTSFTDAAQKYWYYRDRLKYFVMPGTEPGQSIVFTHRNDNYPADRIAITQPRVVDGFYIGVLATEYKLLKDNGQIADAQATLYELNLSLDALIRMDKCEDDIPWNYNYESFDGFFIREDIPPVLTTEMENYFNEGINTTEDYTTRLESGYWGSPYYIDRYIVDCTKEFEDVQNNYYNNFPGDYNNLADYWEYWKNGKFGSNDEIIGTCLGLALVSKLVDDPVVRKKAIDIAGITLSYTRMHPLCDTDEDFCNRWRLMFPDGTKIAENDGGISWAFAHGLMKSGRRICEDFINEFPDLKLNVSPGQQLTYRFFVAACEAGMQTKDNDCMISKLLAISGYNPPSPIGADRAIFNITDKYQWDVFYLMLWAVLHDKNLDNSGFFNASRLLDQIQTAPCSGPFRYSFAEDYNCGSHCSKTVIPTGGWGSYLRYQVGPYTQYFGCDPANCDVTRGIFSGVDYMLLYNLACLAFPDGFSANSSHYSFPYYINLNNRVISDAYLPIILSGPMSNIELGSVTNPEELRGISTISTDMVVSNQAMLYPNTTSFQAGVYGDITLKAGESIKLTDGFRVDAGAHFLARIESYSCGGLSYKNLAAPPWSENYRGSYYDTLISVPMDNRAPIVYSEDNYEEEDFDMPLWEDYYMYDTTAATELAVGVWLNPNPCANKTTLTLVSESEQFLTIELFDMTGQKRATLFEGNADNNFTLDVDMSFYAKGMYLLRISGAGGSKVVRFVKE